MINKNLHPQRIWKYADFETALLILKNGSIKFQNPKNFNDPLDCSMDGVLFNLQGASEGNTGEIEEIRLRLRESGRRFCDESVCLVYEAIQRKKIESALITCFSKNGNNTLMWAHYADSYKGICLEFDNSHDRFDKAFFDLKYAAQGSVLYDFVDPVNYFANKEVGFQKIFTRKNKDWKYEEEYRYIIYNEYDQKFQGLYRFKKHFLKGITFGARCSEENIQKVLEFCHENELTNLIFKRSVIKGMQIVYEPVNILK